jgi:hypothetical protein
MLQNSATQSEKVQARKHRSADYQTNKQIHPSVLIRQNMIQSWSDKTYQRKSKNKKRKTKFISDSSESESD